MKLDKKTNNPAKKEVKLNADPPQTPYTIIPSKIHESEPQASANSKDRDIDPTFPN